MELDSACQVSPDQLQSINFDAIIAVSGYESRCTHMVSQLNISNIPYRMVLAFNEKKDLLYRDFNDKKFRELGFKFYDVPSYDPLSIFLIFNTILKAIDKNNINILIDYSSMPKVWYSEILNYFNSREDALTNVNLWFSYAPSEFIKSASSIGNKYVDPIKPKSLNDKPIALILGLGYEKGRAQDFARQLNAEITYAFYANPAIDSRYVQEVLDNNQPVLRHIKQEQIIPYPIFDLNSVNDTLTQLCINLRMNYQVLLAPVGPKPFTLMCFILASRYPDIKICRVSSVLSSKECDHKAHGESLVYKVEFTNEETDY
jgi:hypothetical protein